MNAKGDAHCMADENAQVAATKFHRLKSIRFIGGFLDGTKLEFADGLNCLIGHRGTGKTTALEFIRYALGEVRGNGDADAARRRVESLVQANLGGGRIEIVIETKDGIEYCVSRTAGEPPLVFTAEGEPTNIALGSSNVFRADVYSQNEVETIADDPLSQLGLLDSLIAEPIAEIEAAIRSTIGKLRTNSLAIIETREKLASLSDALSELPAIEEKLKQFAATGGRSADEINQAHQQKALRDREARAVDEILDFLRSHLLELKACRGAAGQRVRALEEDMLAGPNGEALEQVLEALRACDEKVDRLLAEACATIEQAGKAIRRTRDELTARHQRQEAAFRKLIEKHKEAEAQSAERARLERKRNQLLASQKTSRELRRKLEETRGERTVLLDRLSELRDQRFRMRKEQAERISNRLGPSVRVRVEQFGNRNAYRAFLENALAGKRISRNVVARRIADALSPAELSAIIAGRDQNALVDQAGLNSNQAAQVVDALGNDRRLFDLETVELLDRPWIELLDGEQYKDSLSLSTGQKCTAVLPILMLDAANPLLIDQPEDNLDNSFIYETIVKNIRDIKSRRQMIFVTHNPNIPVLGDAERVFVLHSDGVRATVARVGTVDECKEDIVTLLEGGEEAFRERQRRYRY